MESSQFKSVFANNMRFCRCCFANVGTSLEDPTSRSFSTNLRLTVVVETSTPISVLMAAADLKGWVDNNLIAVSSFAEVLRYLALIE